MTNDVLISLLIEQIETVYRATLADGDSPRTIRRREIISAEPKIGDLVLIFHFHPETNPSDRLGWLVEIKDTPMPSWSEKGTRPVFRYWIIETLDGKRIEWVNVRVIRVAKDIELKQPEPVTRAA